MFVPNDFIPYAFIFIALLLVLAMKKNKVHKNNEKQLKESQIKNFEAQINRDVLEKAESKLKALKDLYHQDLIDSKIYLSKSEMIAKSLSKEIGEEMMYLTKVKQKIIFSDLKKEIKKKIFNDDIKHGKTNIDNLISAVDDKIRKESFRNDEK